MTSYKYTKEMLEKYVPLARSNRHLIVLITGNPRPSGGSQNHIARLIKKYDIDTSHFKGKGHGIGSVRKTASEWFVVLPDGSARTRGLYLRRALLESGVLEICAACGQGNTWNSKILKLQVDHQNGNYLDNSKDNLRFLCPNCHTQTENWGYTGASTPMVEGRG